MLVAPDTHLRIANGEAVSLELDVSEPVAVVRLLPRTGPGLEIPISGGKFEFPPLGTPNAVLIEWAASGSGEMAYTATAEVVSRHYFSLQEFKAYGGDQDDFDRMREERLFWARAAATEVFEEAAHRSFVERIGRTRDYGQGGFLPLAHHDVRKVISGGYVQVSDSQLARLPGCGPFPRDVEYIYGAEHMPAEVSRAVLELAAYILRPSNRPVGATGESTDAGYIHFTTAGRDGATAIPEVNAAIEQFGAGVRYVW